MKRHLLFLLHAILLMFLTDAAQAGQSVIRILHINDFHGFAEPYKPYGSDEMLGGISFLAAEAERLSKEKPTLLLAAGDMIQGANWTNMFLGESVIELMNEMQVNRPLRNRQAWGRIDLTTHFSVDNAIFILLDSQIVQHKRKIEGEQYDWLENLLANSTKKHKFVFLHHPMYPEKGKGHNYGRSLDKYPKQRDRLQSLFVRYKVTAVFEGHEHLYLRKKINGIMHIITGGGGAPLYAEEKDGGFYHFIRITVNGDKVVGEVVDLEGRVKDSF